MAKARQRAEWSRTSSLLLFLANMFQGPNEAPVTAADLGLPFAERPLEPEKEDVSVLCAIFGVQKPKEKP